MKFSTREDIDAPIEAVFDMLCDFSAYERAAMRRGAEVRRLDQLSDIGEGMKWDARFKLRGKPRELEIELTSCKRPSELHFESHSKGLQGWTTLDLMALSRTRTRVAVALEVKPISLPARLLIQSFKLAKSSLTKRFKLRVAEFAKDLEDRHGRMG